jgi:hypothetical protein
MFKAVEYVGFEGKPELEAQARHVTPALADEIRRWRDDIEVRWAPAPADGALKLTLSLTLAEGISGSQTGTFEPNVLAEDWLVRNRCRGVWADLLGTLSVELEARIEEALSEPSEV